MNIAVFKLLCIHSKPGCISFCVIIVVMHETFFVSERMHDIFPIQLQADKSIRDMHDQQNQRNMIVLEHYCYCTSEI